MTGRFLTVFDLSFCFSGYRYKKKSAVNHSISFSDSLFLYLSDPQLMLMAVLNCLFDSLNQMLR